MSTQTQQEVVDLEALREQFLHTEGGLSSRVTALVIGTALLVSVLVLVKRRTLREEYTPIWVTAAFLAFLASVRLDWLRSLSHLIGAWTTSSTLFLLGEVFLVCLALNYAVRLSRQSLQIKELAQESAILRRRIEDLEGRAKAGPADAIDGESPPQDREAD
ncbi:MAG: DUF2304 domain-containing protein [Planctomycetota bacterium]